MRVGIMNMGRGIMRLGCVGLPAVLLRGVSVDPIAEDYRQLSGNNQPWARFFDAGRSGFGTKQVEVGKSEGKQSNITITNIAWNLYLYKWE